MSASATANASTSSFRFGYALGKAFRRAFPHRRGHKSVSFPVCASPSTDVSMELIHVPALVRRGGVNLLDWYRTNVVVEQSASHPEISEGASSEGIAPNL